MKGIVRVSCCLMFLLISPFTMAGEMGSYSEEDSGWDTRYPARKPAPRKWHLMGAVGGGVSIPSNAGITQLIPIRNPITDEFFNYKGDSSIQVSGLFDVYLGAEWNFTPGWLLQLGVDYNQSGSFSQQGPLTQGADIQSENTYSYSYNIAAKQILFQGKLLYTIDQRYHPYLLAGIGVAHNQSSDFTTTVPPFLTFTRMYTNNNDNSLSYGLGFGLDVDVTPCFRLGLGYRFSDFGKAGLGSASIDGTPVSGTLTQSNVHDNQVLAQLTVII